MAWQKKRFRPFLINWYPSFIWPPTAVLISRPTFQPTTHEPDGSASKIFQTTCLHSCYRHVASRHVYALLDSSLVHQIDRFTRRWDSGFATTKWKFNRRTCVQKVYAENKHSISSSSFDSKVALMTHLCIKTHKAGNGNDAVAIILLATTMFAFHAGPIEVGR